MRALPVVTCMPAAVPPFCSPSRSRTLWWSAARCCLLPCWLPAASAAASITADGGGGGEDGGGGGEMLCRNSTTAAATTSVYNPSASRHLYVSNLQAASASDQGSFHSVCYSCTHLRPTSAAGAGGSAACSCLQPFENLLLTHALTMRFTSASSWSCRLVVVVAWLAVNSSPSAALFTQSLTSGMLSPSIL